jgi:hypothetical protein
LDFDLSLRIENAKGIVGASAVYAMALNMGIETETTRNYLGIVYTETIKTEIWSEIIHTEIYLNRNFIKNPKV